MSETILILDGQTVQALPFASYLKKSGYRVELFCSSKSYGYYSRYPDKKILCPDVIKDPNIFFTFFINYLKDNSIDAIVPMNDDSATFVSKNKTEIKEYTELLIPDYDIYIEAFDKNRLMRVCRDNGFSHPRTSDLSTETLVTAADHIGFPAILKPNITSGARGMKVISSLKELESVYPEVHSQYGDCHLQKFIDQRGRQYKVQIFTDLKGTNISTAMEKIRFYPLKGGSSCCSCTIKHDQIVELCFNVLKKIGWVGFADFDLIEDPDDGKIKIMEINPRVPACIRASFVSGIDFATIIVDFSLGKKLKSYTYSPGNYLRYLGLEVLWFLKSNHRFTSKPNFMSFLGRNIYYQDGNWCDPLPLATGTFLNIKKMLNPSFRKAKSGM